MSFGTLQGCPESEIDATTKAEIFWGFNEGDEGFLLPDPLDLRAWVMYVGNVAKSVGLILRQLLQFLDQKGHGSITRMVVDNVDVWQCALKA